MIHKLLQKTRKPFLQNFPAENLMPRIRIGKRKTLRPQRQGKPTTPSVQSRWLDALAHKEENPLLLQPMPNGWNEYAPDKGIEKIRKKKQLSESGEMNRIGVLELIEMAIRSKNDAKKGFLSLRWHERFPSLALFLRNQFQQGKRDSWNLLFPIHVHERNKKHVRVKDEIKNQYLEYKKLAIFYGNLPRRRMAQVMRSAIAQGGELEFNFLSLLERRLDVSLKRLLFFPTLHSARRWIHQGRIVVNSQIRTTSSYLLQPGDFICIKKSSFPLWRKEWLGRFSPGPVLSGYPNAANRGDSPARSSGRSLVFPPNLMQKWYLWSNLWSNSRELIAKGELLGWNQHLSQPFFTESAFAGYTRFSKGAALKTFPSVQAEGFSSTPSPWSTPVLRWFHEKLSKVGKKENPFFLQFFSICLAFGEQAQVVDGLCQHRWNKLVKKKKDIYFKRKDWQWSCIKPLHFECSYRRATAIFLYPPQKLVWPSTIDVLLLKKALNCRG